MLYFSQVFRSFVFNHGKSFSDMCDISLKILRQNCSNSICILLLLNLQGTWWYNLYESAVYSSVVSWYDEKLWTVFLLYVVVDLSIFLSCCFRKNVSFFYWWFEITLNLLLNAMFNWWNTAFKITKFKLLFSMLRIYFNSFFNFRFSQCLFCISVSIIKVAILHLSLKLSFFSDMLTLANVGVSRFFLHVLMYLISALTFINFLCFFF